MICGDLSQAFTRRSTIQYRAPIMRILLVEDNRLNQELERDLLEAAGHVVDIAGDGVAMHASLADVTPDIVLLDVLLPGRDGVTLLGELRRSRHARLPIIAVTA